MFFDRKSTPPTSRPMARTARSAISRLSGWMTSVTSVAVPPVERLAVERRYTVTPFAGTELAVSPARSSIFCACASSSSRVSTFSCPTPRRGSRLTMSMSWATVCSPSPTTWPGVRRVAATSSPFTTSSRWSSPSRKVSTITERECSRATVKPCATSSSVVSRIEMPRP